MLKKHQILLLLIIINIISVSAHAQDKKYVITSKRQSGLFSCFLRVINHLQWCSLNDKIPVVYWNESRYFQSTGFNGSTNVWEYYFEPVSELTYVSGDKTNYQSWNPPQERVAWFGENNLDDETRKKAHEVIKKYIKIKPNIQNKIDMLHKDFMHGKKTIGIHMRGTDKTKNVPVDAIAAKANKYSDYQFLIATDEKKLLADAQRLINGTIIYYDCYRSENGRPLHKNKPSHAQLGEDVLIEAMLLAQCDMLIHTTSNVSTAVLYFNPYMNHIEFKTK